MMTMTKEEKDAFANRVKDNHDGLAHLLRKFRVLFASNPEPPDEEVAALVQEFEELSDKI